MNKKTKKKTQTPPPASFPLWATIFTIVGISILCSLGYWQVQRLEWKTALLSELSVATETDAMKNRLNFQDFVRGEKTNKPFLSGYLVGEFQHEDEIVIGPRTYKGLPGYHLITPLKLENGGTVMINRGWLPEEQIAREKRPESLTPGMTVVAGMARIADKPNRFTPDNDKNSNKWYWLDIKAVAEKYDLSPITEYVLYEQPQGLRTYTFPRPLGMTWVPPNNHKQYAFFWFSMAGIMALIYILRFFYKKRS